MTTTRSIEIEAPFEDVFAFVADPATSLLAVPGVRTFRISDAETGPDGVLTRPWTARFRWLPAEVSGQVRQEYIPDRRVVERQSDGTVLTKVVEPSGDGSRLTYTYEVCTRMPLLIEAELFVSSGDGVWRGGSTHT